MKITQSQLRRIIKEELKSALGEGRPGWDSDPIEMDARKFGTKVHQALYKAGYNTEAGKSIHKADAYQLVADALGVETAQIADLYKAYLGQIANDPQFANNVGVQFDGNSLAAIG